MKKILIYEYITGGGLIGKNFDHSLLSEANLIIDSLISKTDSIVNFFCDYRYKYKNNKNAILITANNHDTIYYVCRIPYSTQKTTSYRGFILSNL